MIRIWGGYRRRLGNRIRWEIEFPSKNRTIVFATTKGEPASFGISHFQLPQHTASRFLKSEISSNDTLWSHPRDSIAIHSISDQEVTRLRHWSSLCTPQGAPSTYLVNNDSGYFDTSAGVLGAQNRNPCSGTFPLWLRIANKALLCLPIV